jgi:uroporphyrinogen-III synthase
MMAKDSQTVKNSARSALPLQGKGIVVTRPVHQADSLCRLIEAQGGRAICYPTLAIFPPSNPNPALAVVEHLESYDMAVFVSVNAVQWGMELMLSRRHLPPALRLVAIGRATAQALERDGTSTPLVPKPNFTSEALLALPEMQEVAGRRIVIFRGEGGVNLLGTTRAERGAEVCYAEVYRGGKPAARADELVQYWSRGEIQGVIVTSSESLENLFDMVGEIGRQWLCNTPLVVVSARTQQLALQLGANHPPLVAREVSDEAIVETLHQIPPNPIPTTFGDVQ